MFQHLLLPLVILGNLRRWDELEDTWVLASKESRTLGVCVGRQVSDRKKGGDVRKTRE